MRPSVFELDACSRASFAQDGVAVRHRSERGGIDHRERMEGIALHAVALGGRHDETMIEVRIVGSQHCSLASVAANLATDEPKQLAHRVLLVQRIAPRIREVNAGDPQ